MRKRSGKEKLCIGLVFIVVLALVVAFVLTGNNRELTKQVVKSGGTSREQLDELTASLGVGGYATIVLLSMLQTLCPFLPSEPVQVLAGVAYGFGVGMALFITGFAMAISIVYFLYKVYGEKIQNYFIKEMHLDRENVSVSDRVTLIILLLYIMPGIPYAMICFIYASLGVKYRKYLPVNVIGAVPSSCIGIGLGHLTVLSANNWILSAALFVLVLAVMIILIRKKEWLFDKVNKLATTPAYSAKTQVRKRDPVFYWIMYRLVAFWFFIKGVRVKITRKCEKKLPNPCIVLCNHGSFVDFFFAAKTLRGNNVNFITARLYFYHKWLGRVLKRLGCFPKSMFATDIESTKNCLRVLKEGRVLAMMPEARLSTVGEFEDIQDKTYSFLKKAGVPVYTICFRGDHFADPKWGKGFRRGAVVEAELELLFEADQLKEMTCEQIGQAVEQRLYYDEFAWLSTRPKVRYRNRRLAEGLENILTVCPVCGGHYTIRTKKRKILCDNCGLLTTMDKRYGFTGDFQFENYARWYNWQKEQLKQSIEGDPDYRLESRVKLRHGDHRGKRLTRDAGEGTCVLSREGLRYTGTRNGETVDILFPPEQVYRLLFGAGESFEIYEPSQIFFFLPEEGKSAVQWYMASAILYDLNFPKENSKVVSCDQNDH